MYFNELTEEQKLQVSKDTTYTVESLEDEDPYLVPADEMSEYIMELFYDTHTIEEAIESYIDEEKVIKDYSYDYITTEFDDEVHFFRGF